MTTVTKAMKLLEYFGDSTPEIGLSNLARMSGIDKATVLRMLKDLAESGLVEQDSQSRNWRLGAGILRLARLREASFPVTRVLTPILESLSEATGETAHASLLSGRDLGTVGAVEPTRSNRVYIEAGLILPLHATASGLAFTAFARPEQRQRVLARVLDGFTASTPIQAETLAAQLASTAERGYSLADQTFEAEVFGIAAPLFDARGFATGALAVASPSSRVTPEHIAMITAALIPAAKEATRGLGGQIPANYRPSLSPPSK